MSQVIEVFDRPFVHIVLYQPEIPGNTGAVGRTCVALGAKLWLVRPLGFRIDEKTLRRAGLDYWPHLDWEVVNDWEDLLNRFQKANFGGLVNTEQNQIAHESQNVTPIASPNLPTEKFPFPTPQVDYRVSRSLENKTSRNATRNQTNARDKIRSPISNFWFLTKTATRSLYEASFSPGDVFVFGPETSGLPPSMLETYREQLLRIPTSPRVRSLNLATSAAICAYEAFRQLNSPTLIDLP